MVHAPSNKQRYTVYISYTVWGLDASPQKKESAIAHRYTHGRYKSDSRNAILAWQTGQADLTDGTQGKFAKIDQDGRIEWFQGAEPIQGENQTTITVSNTIWDSYDGYDLAGYDINDIWDEAYQTGYDDGQEELLNGAVPDWTPHHR